MIPKLHYISQGKTPKEHLKNIQNACSSGAELVQLRLKNVDPAIIFETAKAVKEITDHFQTRLIINDHYKVAEAVKADGVHLGKLDTCPLVARKQLASWQIIGGTANTLEDCKILLDKNVDYIGLGPYRFTKTKVNLSPTLGIHGYSEICKRLHTKIPLIAIGGIMLEDVAVIMKTGVHGIAVSGSITQDFNKISSFKEILNQGETTEQRWSPLKNK